MPSLMELSQRKSRLFTSRVLLLGFSVISLLIGAWAGAAHYRKLAWGDPWQPIGWLLSMFFLLCAFLPDSRGLATGLKSLDKTENSILSLLDPVLCSLAPLEFPDRAVERKRTF